MIEVTHLFRPLDEELLNLLKELSAEDWNKPTVAGTWRVRDVAAHLLDGNIRALSMQRDRYFGEQPPEINGYRDLVNWLNQLNDDWVKAMNRLSPQALILLHEATGHLTSKYYSSLNPLDEAIFAVEWAGESRSYNWMHLAREYTEKWHHQQQIRDATDRQGIMNEQFYPPFISTYLLGLPHAFRDVRAAAGTTVQITVTSSIGDVWYLTRNSESWQLNNDVKEKSIVTSISIDPDIAWKLFSKNIRPYDIKDLVNIEGDKELAEHVLQMVSVMA